MTSSWFISIIILIHFIFVLLLKVESDLGSHAVAVIIPIYNSNISWLNETLNCVLNQSIIKDIELLLIDDGSSKEYQTELILIIKNLLWNRVNIRYIRHASNMGLSYARNTGAILCHSDYILFLDPDDLMEDTAVEKLYISLMYAKKRDPSIFFTYPSVKHFVTDPNIPISIESDPFNPFRLLKYNYIPSFAVIEKKVYLWLGGMCEGGRIRYFEDYDFWLRSVGFGLKGFHLDEPLFSYRRHGNGLSDYFKRLTNEWHDELRQVNAIAYGKVMRSSLFDDDEDSVYSLSIDTAPCFRPISTVGPLGLLYWRHVANTLDFHSRSIKSEIYSSSPSFKRLRVKSTEIIMIIPWMKVGGAEQYDLDIIKVIKSHGHSKVRISLIIDIHNMEHDTCGKFKELVDEIIFIRSILGPSINDQAEVNHLLKELILARRPKIIYVRSSMNGYRVAAALKMASRKNLFRFVDILHVVPSDTEGWIYSTLPLVPFLDHRILISDHLREFVKSFYQSTGVPSKYDQMISVIRPSLPTSTTATKPDIPSCYNSKYTLLFIGRFEEQKDPILWAKVAKELHLLDKNILFLLIGEGYLKDQVIYELSGLQNKVLFMESQDRNEIMDLMQRGLYRDDYGIVRSSPCYGKTILLMTSTFEGIPFVVLEAIQSKIPVIMTDIPASHEINSLHSVDVINIVSTRDAQTMAQEVIRLMEDDGNIQIPQLAPEFNMKKAFTHDILKVFNLTSQ